MYLRDLVISAESLVAATADDAVRERYSTFQRHTFCVVDLYLQLLGKRCLKTNGTAKVIVDATAGQKAKGSFNQFPGVFQVAWPFPFHAYFGLKETGKKKRILAFLQEALLFVAAEKGWDQTVLRHTYEAVLSRGIVNEGYMSNGKAWLSPNGKLSVKVYYAFTIDRIVISAVFFDHEDREIGRLPFIEELPSDDALGYFLGSVKWTSNRRVVLQSRYRVASWAVNVEEATSKHQATSGSR